MALKKGSNEPEASPKASGPEKNSILWRIRNDTNFRSVVSAILKSGWSLAFAAYHLVLACMYRSYWFLTMGVYYLVVAVMKGSALHFRTQEQLPGSSFIKRRGLLMFFLALVFSGVVYMTIADKRNPVKSTVVAITMAAWTFYCVVNAIVKIAQLKKHRTAQTILLRNLALACALGSLFGLERMLLGTFGDGDEASVLTMEVASGAGIFLIIILLGISLLILSSRMKAVEADTSGQPL